MSVWSCNCRLLIGIPVTRDSCDVVHHQAPRSNKLPLRPLSLSGPSQKEYRLLYCGERVSPSFFQFLYFSFPDHGFCDGCMCDWPELNRVGPRRKVKTTTVSYVSQTCTRIRPWSYVHWNRRARYSASSSSTFGERDHGTDELSCFLF